MPSDFDDYSDEELDSLMEELIEEGYLIPTGFDDEGKILYQTTQRFREDFPEMFAEQIAETNNTVYELWTLGLVDVTVKEDINDWIVLTNKNTMTCDLNGLSKEQRNVILQLRYKQGYWDSGNVEF